MRVNGIGLERAAAVGKELETNQSARELAHSWNDIDAEAAAAVTKALRRKASILSLNMGYDNLIAPLLERNKKPVRTHRDHVTLCLIAARKFRAADCATTLGLLDKNVVRLIVRTLYDKTRGEHGWLRAIFPDIELVAKQRQ